LLTLAEIEEETMNSAASSATGIANMKRAVIAGRPSARVHLVCTVLARRQPMEEGRAAADKL